MPEQETRLLFAHPRRLEILDKELADSQDSMETFIEDGSLNITLTDFINFEIERGDPEDSAPLEKLTFSIIVRSQNDDKLSIEVKFDNPLYVSSGKAPDKLRVTFFDTRIFVDKVSGKTMESGLVLERILPKQFASKSAGESIEAVGSTVASIGNTFAILQILISLLLAASLKSMWNLMNVI